MPTASHARATAIAEAGLDWLLVIHPVSMRWLIGQDNKSYTAFQCLAVSASPASSSSSRARWSATSSSSTPWSTRCAATTVAEPEDPMEAFSKFADDLGLKNARVGMEVPSWYLNAHQYIRVKDILGKALVAEPSGLDAQPEAREVAAGDRLSPQIGGHRRRCLEGADRNRRRGPHGAGAGGAAYNAILKAGSAIPASTMNLMTGERSCFVLGAPTERKQKRGDTGLVELGGAYRRYTSTLGRQWVLGQPSERLSDLHKLVLEASDACMAEMRDGAPAIKPHEALKAMIRQGTAWIISASTRPAMAWRRAFRRPGASRPTCSAAARMCCGPAW